ncbi:MAG: hypothetical protein JWQ89_1931 [Devosia sp.]|uniref:GyrI-like domain-containing protein n=1 Tax=Devosia sp. TaxID=1871048 RepID=UPI00263228FE|nr:GyrI-like domain-containing protein [Devosia sp.]MDB5540204.1 hypothetical protein [Devosia sp.]
MGLLFGGMNAQKIQPHGPVFFKYNIVRMPELEIEFATGVAAPVTPAGELVGGVLPAGRYAELTFLGRYDKLIDANAALIGWVREQGVQFDMREMADGDHFAARVEIYLNSPAEEPDSDKWETIVSFKLKD